MFENSENLFASKNWLSCWEKHCLIGKTKTINFGEKKLGLELLERKIGFAGFSFLELLGQQYGYGQFGSNEDKNFLPEIFSQKTDCIYFKHLPENEPLFKEAKNLSKKNGLMFSILKEEPCFVLKPGKSFEQYIGSFNRERRKKFKRDLKKASFLEPSVVLGCSDKEFSSLFNGFVELHLLSVHAKGQGSVFDFKKYREFFKDVFFNANKQNNLVFVCLKDQGKLVGVLAGLIHKNTFYFMNMGYKPKLKNVSIGNVLVLNSILYCCENGIETFDMLAGGKAYKTSFGAKEVLGNSFLAAKPFCFAMISLKRLAKRFLGAIS